MKNLTDGLLSRYTGAITTIGGVRSHSGVSKFILSLIVAVFLLPGFVLTASGAETPKGTGTKGNPFIISSASDWNYFAEKILNKGTYVISGTGVTTGNSNKYSEAYYVLTADISNQTLLPFGGNDEGTHFNGNFDGNGHKISNCLLGNSNDGNWWGNSSKGVKDKGAAYFPTIDSKGVVANLTLQPAENFISGDNVDKRAGICYNLNGTIQNCTVKGKIQIQGGIAGIVNSTGLIIGCEVTNFEFSKPTGNSNNRIGGICVELNGGTVSLCNVTNLKISQTDGNCTAGGICAEMKANSTIMQCMVQGNTTIAGQDPQGVGGLVGVADMKGCTVSECGVSGNDLEVKNNSQSANNPVSGLIGNVTASDNNSVLSNCYVEDAKISSSTGNQSGNYNEAYALCGGDKASNISVDNCFVLLSDNNVGTNNFIQGNNTKQQNTYYATHQTQTTQGSSNPAVKSETDLVNQIKSDDNKFEVIQENNKDKIVLAYTVNSQKVITTLYVNKWNFVGSVIDNQKLSTLNNNKGTLNKAHDMAAVMWDYTKNNWSSDYLIAEGNTFQRGQGYFVWAFDKTIASDYSSENLNTETLNEDKTNWTQSGSSASSSVSVGQLNNTGSTSSFGSNINGNGYWYALANPNNTQLSVETFKNNNTIQGNGVYIWDAEKGTAGEWLYTTKTVPGANGFMVACTTNVFTPNLSANANGNSNKKSLKKSSEISRMSFVAENSANQRSFAFACQNAEAQNGFDANDSYLLLNEETDYVQPYFTVEDNAIIDNFFKSLPYTVDMNFYAKQTGEVKFYVNNVPENMEVSVINSEDNSQTILSEGEAFTFFANEGSNSNRFKVKFANKSLALQDLSEPDIEIKNINNTLTVNAKDIRFVKIINYAGAEVMAQETEGDSFKKDISSLNAGVYIVNVTTANGSSSEKIIKQ